MGATENAARTGDRSRSEDGRPARIDIAVLAGFDASGGTGAVGRALFDGTSGDDTLTGSDGDDILNGLGGDDSLLGFGGDDQLFGGDGYDLLDGGAGSDLLEGGDGHDIFRVFDEGPGNVDTLTGGAGSDVFNFWISGIDGQVITDYSDEDGIGTYGSSDYDFEISVLPDRAIIRFDLGSDGSFDTHLTLLGDFRDGFFDNMRFYRLLPELRAFSARPESNGDSHPREVLIH